MDTIVGGIATVNVSAGATLNAAQAASGTIIFSGALTGNVTVVWPSVQGWWRVYNNTTGNFYAQITCGGGQRIAIDQGGGGVDIQTDGTNVFFANLPFIGALQMTAVAPLWLSGCTIPPWINCDGGTFNTVTYPYLFARLGTNVTPDLRGRSPANLNQGTSRITTANSGINGDVLFSGGGGELATVSQAQLPSANFSAINSISVSNTYQFPVQGTQSIDSIQSPATGTPVLYWRINPNSGSSNLTYSNSLQNISVSSGGSGTGHANMQPTTITGFTFIRAG